jgi:hypothetical protein
MVGHLRRRLHRSLLRIEPRLKGSKRAKPQPKLKGERFASAGSSRGAPRCAERYHLHNPRAATRQRRGRPVGASRAYHAILDEIAMGNRHQSTCKPAANT